MKPLERIFFIACINLVGTTVKKRRVRLYNVVNLFVSFGFSEKQLYTYVGKWSDKGFYNYGVSIRAGWFEIDQLVGEYKVLYERYKKD